MRCGKTINLYSWEAQNQWRLYDNEICHGIQKFIDSEECEFKKNHNFYEFSKGFVMAKLRNEYSIERLKSKVKNNINENERIKNAFVRVMNRVALSQGDVKLSETIDSESISLWLEHK